MSQKKSSLDKEALDYHKNGRPGKLEISPTTPLNSSHELSLLTLRVATPCLEMKKIKILLTIMRLKEI